MKPFRLLGGLLVSLVLSTGAAQTVADVQKLPLVHDPLAKTPRAALSAADQQAVTTLARTLNARPEVQDLKRKWPYSQGVSLKTVLFTISAPFRSGTPERLTVFSVSEAEPPVLLFVLSGAKGLTADLVEPAIDTDAESCWVGQGYSLRDVDQNGLREVAFTLDCTPGEMMLTDLYLFRYGPGRWVFWQAFPVSSSYGGGWEGHEESIKIHVRKGPSPQFYGLLDRQKWAGPPEFVSRTEPTRTVGVIKYAPGSADTTWRVRHLF
ncbi:hypothetical protein GCM10008959_34160 [Deinococcus seoulensis]|uniref:DUF3047 domain-containing protein n=1 Tax=Deinococcus seoulensis TaxID=1837379 RepID=A0ABQ2RV48_9DEIO|nr:hypothetical protein [Deinococcus seoulensis]GGR69298.1 hypothetical protein GCM10008959_34160 [Deinococcus seoulensis]